jgi:hypothetical protein
MILGCGRSAILSTLAVISVIWKPPAPSLPNKGDVESALAADDKRIKARARVFAGIMASF